MSAFADGRGGLTEGTERAIGRTSIRTSPTLPGTGMVKKIPGRNGTLVGHVAEMYSNGIERRPTLA